MTKAATPQPRASLTNADVVGLCGDILDWKVAAIIGTGGTIEDLEEAVAWLSGEDDIMGGERKPLAGHAAEIYDILGADEEPDER